MVLNSKNAAERAARGLPEPPLCAGHKKDGTPCKKHPIRGSTVCRVHGGAAPQVRKRAQERLQAAADILMAQLLKIAASAESEAVRLSAVKDALDRAGFSATHMVKLAAVQPWENFLTGIIDDDIFEDVPAGPRARPRKIGPSHSRVGVEPDEDTTDEDNATAAQYDPHADDSRTTYNVPGRTVRSKVIYPDPTPEQAATAASRTEQRMRTAIFDMDYPENPDDRRTEYGGRRSTRPTDPNRPPQYVREAMEADGEDWRAGEGGGSRRADLDM
jgi:hypothetical protein